MTVELWSFSTALGVEPGELRGMSVEARDGGVGRIVEVVDRIGGAHLVVDTGPWIFGKNVMLPAGVITGIDREAACVFIDRVKDDVKSAPDHDPDAADDPAQRDALTAHYGGAATSAPAATPFGGLDEAGTATPAPPISAPAEPITASAERFDVPLGGESDAGSDRLAESAAPPTTGAAWPRQDEDRSGESVGSGIGDATTTLGEERETGPTGDRPTFRPDEPAGTGPAPSEQAPTKRRFARETDSGADSAEGASRASRAPRKSAQAAPISRYDSLTAAEVIERLPNLSQRELAEVERYEKRHESRRTVLTRIESLREKEPWRGYDDEKVEQIRKKLADADDERAKRVRDYERRHRDRKGVMEAARRAVASS